MTSGSIRTRVLYSGRVQGVGFRWRASRIARDHAVAGFVRNLADGRVELVAEGGPSEVRCFLDEVRERLRGNIGTEDREEGPATGGFAGFSIRA